MPTKPQGIGQKRFLKLVADHQNEVLVAAQRRAIGKALEGEGRKLFKLSGKPVYEINNRSKTRVYYQDGKWTCENPKIQKLINRAIAGVQQ